MKTGGATKRKKTVREGRRVQFEMSLAGVAAAALAGVVLAGWMFFLGVWAGQTILGPPVAGGGDKNAPKVKAVMMPRKETSSVAPLVVGGPQTAKGEKGEKAKEFYALQVGAFQDRKKAEQELIRWRVRGEKSFLVEADGRKEHFTRVYVGRHARQEDAQVHAQRLAAVGRTLRIVRLPVTVFGPKP